jgi:protein CpxP
MTRLNTTRFALSVLLAGSALAAVVPAQAQPMMGEMGVHHNEGRMHERMTKHWEQRQAELKAKLQLTPAQEPAWNAFVQGMKMPAKPLAQPVDRDALAKMSTPERLDKMNAAHEANLAAMQTHIKQRTEATRTFYGQLSADQQKVFDAQTLPEQGHWKGPRN